MSARKPADQIIAGLYYRQATLIFRDDEESPAECVETGGLGRGDRIHCVVYTLLCADIAVRCGALAAPIGSGTRFAPVQTSPDFEFVPAIHMDTGTFYAHDHPCDPGGGNLEAVSMRRALGGLLSPWSRRISFTLDRRMELLGVPRATHAGTGSRVLPLSCPAEFMPDLLASPFEYRNEGTEDEPEFVPVRMRGLRAEAHALLSAHRATALLGGAMPVPCEAVPWSDVADGLRAMGDLRLRSTLIDVPDGDVQSRLAYSILPIPDIPSIGPVAEAHAESVCRIVSESKVRPSNKGADDEHLFSNLR